MEKPRPRCGSRFHNGKEVPLNAEIKIHEGRECYLSGIDEGYRIVKYIDTGEIRRFRINN